MLVNGDYRVISMRIFVAQGVRTTLYQQNDPLNTLSPHILAYAAASKLNKDCDIRLVASSECKLALPWPEDGGKTWRLRCTFSSLRLTVMLLEVQRVKRVLIAGGESSRQSTSSAAIEIANQLAAKYRLDRLTLDRFAAESNLKALQSEEYLPSVEGLPTTDQGPRLLTMPYLETLPSLVAGGPATEANVARLANGGAAVLIVSENAKHQFHEPFLIKAVGASKDGLRVDTAIERALSLANLKLRDIGLFQIEEQSSAQLLAIGKSLRWDWDRVNIWGGNLAYGHPLGANGAVLLVQLMAQMSKGHIRLGLAAGEEASEALGTAVILERL